MNKKDELNVLTLQEQLYEILNEQIKKGQLKAGEKIPSEKELGEKYNISRVTVRKSLERLSNENLLVKKKGKGTFVNSVVHTEDVIEGESFTQACLKMGKIPTTEIIDITMERTASTEFEDLKSDTLTLIKRIRAVDSIPVIYEWDFFPDKYKFVDQPDFLKGSFIDGIEKKLNIKLKFFNDKFEIIFANKEKSSLLDCPIGTPLLEVTQRVYDTNHQIIYINKQYIQTTKYIYSVQSEK